MDIVRGTRPSKMSGGMDRRETTVEGVRTLPEARFAPYDY